MASKAGQPAAGGGQSAAQQQAQPASGNTAPSQSGVNAPSAPVMVGNKKAYKVRGVTFEVDPNYDLIKAIGFGAYGLVCSAKDTATAGSGAGEYVAIKKIPKVFDDLVDGKRVLRELKLLRMLKHKNILRLHRLLVPREGYEAFRDVYIVTELLDTDLHYVIKSKQRLTEEHQQYFVYQLLRSLVYLHSAGVIHRDLKPGNLLLNSNCDLKLCDFGLARGGIPFSSQAGTAGSATNSPASGAPLAAAGSTAGSNAGSDDASASPDRRASLTGGATVGTSPQAGVIGLPPNASAEAQRLAALDAAQNPSNPPAYELTDYVVTRWYRPPELLLMSRYAHSVDLWSAGCILAEMVTRKPLFPGKDYLGQLDLVAKLVPLPDVTAAATSSATGTSPTTSPGNAPALGTAHASSSSSSSAAVGAAGGASAGDAFVDSKEGRKYLAELRAQYGAVPEGPEADRKARENFAATLPGASSAALDLLSKLLVFNPRRRATALQAMRHPFFAGVHAKDDEEFFVFPPAAATAAAPPTVAAQGAAPLAPGATPEQAHHAKMWTFDLRELSARDLRDLFWEEMTAYAPAAALAASGTAAASAAASPAAAAAAAAPKK